MDINSILDAAIENVLLKRSLLKQVKSEQGSLFDMLEKYISLSEGIGVIPIVLSENDVADLFKLSTDQEFLLAQKHEIIVEGGAKVPPKKEMKSVIKGATSAGTVTAAAKKAGVTKGTASRWGTGRRRPISPEGMKIFGDKKLKDLPKSSIKDKSTINKSELGTKKKSD